MTNELQGEIHGQDNLKIQFFFDFETGCFFMLLPDGSKMNLTISDVRKLKKTVYNSEKIYEEWAAARVREQNHSLF